jgi:hypothetical protein
MVFIFENSTQLLVAEIIFLRDASSYEINIDTSTLPSSMCKNNKKIHTIAIGINYTENWGNTPKSSIILDVQK